MHRYSEHLAGDAQHIDDEAFLASTYTRYAMVSSCALATAECMPRDELKPSLPDDLDPQQSVNAIRLWHQSNQIDAANTPPATWTASAHYLDRLATQYRDLGERLHQMGSEQTVESFRHIFGALIKQSSDFASQSVVETDTYDPLLNIFMEDVLAIHALGLPDPGAKAAHHAPEYYAQKRQGALTKVAVDSVNLYIRTAKHVTERLEQDEEQALGEYVVLGRIAQRKLEENDYGPEEKTTLQQQIATADQAKKLLIESRLSLVITIAKNYNHTHASTLDIVQEGNLGLIRAAQEFDPSRGIFSNFAAGWIKKYILKSLTYTYPLIRIPYSHGQATEKMRRFIDNFYAENQRTPSKEEIMAGADIGSRLFASAWETASYTAMVSTDQVTGVTKGTLEEVTPDHRSLVPEMAVLHTEDPLINLVHEVLAEAGDPDLGKILALHYGLDLGPTVLSPEFIAMHAIEPGQQYIMKDIAPMLGLSRATAWRRSDKILELLREKMKESPELTELFFRN